LLTGDSLSVEDAYSIGMVSKVFPADRLAEDTLQYARRIAAQPSVSSLLIKESVNQSVDNMGFYNALNACFTLPELNYAHWAWLTKGETILGTPEHGVPDWREAGLVQPCTPHP
jgi:enoyl-CoA hydratase